MIFLAKRRKFLLSKFLLRGKVGAGQVAMVNLPANANHRMGGDVMNMRDNAKRLVLAVELDHSELTVRLMEVGLKMKRPKGRSARSILSEQRLNVASDKLMAATIKDFENMATAAIEYMRDSINGMGTVQ